MIFCLSIKGHGIFFCFVLVWFLFLNSSYLILFFRTNLFLGNRKEYHLNFFFFLVFGLQIWSKRSLKSLISFVTANIYIGRKIREGQWILAMPSLVFVLGDWAEKRKLKSSLLLPSSVWKVLLMDPVFPRMSMLCCGLGTPVAMPGHPVQVTPWRSAC